MVAHDLPASDDSGADAAVREDWCGKMIHWRD